MADFFTEYTRKPAFRIELTEQEIEVLLWVENKIRTTIWDQSVSPQMSLESKGLIRRISVAKRWEATKPGLAVIELLIAAGYKKQLQGKSYGTNSATTKASN